MKNTTSQVRVSTCMGCKRLNSARTPFSTTIPRSCTTVNRFRDKTLGGPLGPGQYDAAQAKSSPQNQFKNTTPFLGSQKQSLIL